MKRLLIAVLALLSINAFALEIQCSTDQDNLDIIIKQSPDTGRTYMLAVVGEAVSPVPLNPAYIQNSDSNFLYSSRDLELLIEKREQGGLLVMEGYPDMTLSNCVEF